MGFLKESDVPHIRRGGQIFGSITAVLVTAYALTGCGVREVKAIDCPLDNSNGSNRIHLSVRENGLVYGWQTVNLQENLLAEKTQHSFLSTDPRCPESIVTLHLDPNSGELSIIGLLNDRSGERPFRWRVEIPGFNPALSHTIVASWTDRKVTNVFFNGPAVDWSNPDTQGSR